MMKYSSCQFRQDWRYAVEQEFATSDGQPFPYAPGGHQGWGDEIAKIPLQDASEGYISSDGSRMAIAAGEDVHVFDTKTQKTIGILKAHMTAVSDIAFQPNNADILLTSSPDISTWTGGKVEVEEDAVIIVWRLDEHTLAATPETTVGSSVARTSAAAALDQLVQAGIEFGPEEREELEKLIAPSIQRMVTKHALESKTRIHGRLQTFSGSSVFSPSGRSMVYLPGNAPMSNDVAQWDMCICHTENMLTPVLTLSGHTDNIIWTGWNHDESLFASASWDSTVRVWNAATGAPVHVFRTGDGCQNWTAAFSPDSKYLAVAEGTTRLHIYNLVGRDGAAKADSDDEAYWVFRGQKECDGTHRTLAWHPNGTWLAVGKDQGDELLLLDVGRRTVLQRRALSTAAARVDREELRRMLAHYPGVGQVRFADAGRKLVAWTDGDDSIEVYDLVREHKWRFGRGGTEDGVPGADAWRDEHGKVTSPSGTGMLVWEREGELCMASLDGDAIRFWSIKLD